MIGSIEVIKNGLRMGQYANEAIDLNHSTEFIQQLIRMACEVSGIKYGRDLSVLLD